MKLFKRIKGSHSVWITADGRVVIADQSGRTPDTTDDGPLYVANDAAPFPCASVAFAVTKDDGREYHVSTCTEVWRAILCARETLAQERAIELRCKADELLRKAEACDAEVARARRHVRYYRAN